MLMLVSGWTRRALAASLAVSGLALSSSSGALELRVSTWNLEHLADSNDEGCVGRRDADYEALALGNAFLR